MITNTNRTTRVLAALALLAAAPAALVACSDRSTASDVATTAENAGIGAKWGACMRAAGFDVEDASDEEIASGAIRSPESAGPGWAEQAATCAQQAGAKRADSAQQQEWARQYDRVASCIREHGFEDLPEQQPGQLDFSAYPRVQDPAFDGVAQRCLAEFAPDTQTQGR